MEVRRVDTWYAGAVPVVPDIASGHSGIVPYVSWSGIDSAEEEDDEDGPEFEGVESAEIVAKRPVGRPKGSKNKVNV
jgi:hypothetical protein